MRNQSQRKQEKITKCVCAMVWILSGSRKGKPGGYSPGSSVGGQPSVKS